MYLNLGWEAAERCRSKNVCWRKDQLVQGIDTALVSSKLMEQKAWDPAARCIKRYKVADM